MDAISNYLAHDHRRCDEFFSAAEAAALRGEWDAATSEFTQFVSAMRRHFAMEEEALFPAFEQFSGNTQGPSQVMRMEHAQMRELFEAMDAALSARDADAYAGASDTLLVLMQQHNLKEEQVLYRMCDRMLARQSGDLIERMDSLRQP